MSRLQTIGITGGIGSGKTTVCRLFETLGVPVYYADDRAKLLMNEQAELKAAIKKEFGNHTYDGEDKLDRKALATIVFNDVDALNKLNALVHPAVGKDSLEWTKAQTEALSAFTSRYTLREAALLYESGSYQSCDSVIVVSAPLEVRIQRVMKRDGVDEASVKARIDKQWPQERKVSAADHVVVNDGNSSLIAQVWRLHNNFIANKA